MTSHTSDDALLTLSDSGPIFHFSHANGYGPLTYQQFLNPFKASYQVIASQHRPLWQPTPEPQSIDSWEPFAEDIVASLATVAGPVTSVGHSMGSAALVMAAAKQPELFKRLVLIEPVLVPGSYFLMIKLFGERLANKSPIVSRTINRVDSWNNYDEAFAHFRPKAVFKRIGDKALWDYVNHGTYRDADNKIHLAYSKEWEARCYLLIHNIWKLLAELSLPVLIIRGANSGVLSESAIKKMQRLGPQHQFIQVPDTGHLIPFEQPQILADHISAWLDSQS